MPNYRRNRVPGGSYFFTVNLHDRRADLLTRHIHALRAAVQGARRRRPFHIDGWVVLPEHMHCIWTLPADDDDYPSRWRMIKNAFSKSLPKTEARTPVQRRRNERGIWQRRYWEHTLRSDVDYAWNMDYLHFNPVKHGWASRVADWPFSTFHRLVRRGVYDADWGVGVDVVLDAGEMVDGAALIHATSDPVGRISAAPSAMFSKEIKT